MDDLYTKVLEKIENDLVLEPIQLPKELGKISYPLNMLQMRCSNWRSERINKMYCMRLKLLLPSLDILGITIYPSPAYDVPLFLFDLSCTHKKIVTYINVFKIADDPEYVCKYIDPFTTVREKYKHLTAKPVPAWLETYQSTCTIYTHPARDNLNIVKSCVLDYLEVYLHLLTSAEKVNSFDRQQQILRFHEQFKYDLATKDGAQKMLAKVIGKKKAARIYNEVLV